MIEIDEAIERIISECRRLVPHRCSTIDALGGVLAEDITADVDSPPHDKSLVDGFAIQLADAGKTLKLIEQVVAGEVPMKPVEPGTTSQIMTGAPVPVGTEAMVMVEDVEQNGDIVRVPENVKANQSIMCRAATFARGDVVLSEGTLCRAIEVGLLSEVGRSEVSVYQPTNDCCIANRRRVGSLRAKAQRRPDPKQQRPDVGSSGEGGLLRSTFARNRPRQRRRFACEDRCWFGG